MRWGATDLDRRREGLARASVISVLAMAGQAGYREARLHTQTDRLAAIPLYLQLGFEPLVRGDPEREVWERVIRLVSGEAGGGTRQMPAGAGAAPDEPTPSFICGWSCGWTLALDTCAYGCFRVRRRQYA